EGHRDRAVVLPEVEVAAPYVEKAELVLAKAVQGLPGIGRPGLADMEGLRPLDRGGLERARARLLGEYRAALRVEERDGSRDEVDARLEPRRAQGGGAPVGGELPGGRRAAPAAHDQAVMGEERLVPRACDPDGVVGAGLDLQERAALGEDDAIRRPFHGGGGLVARRAQRRAPDAGKDQERQGK